MRTSGPNFFAKRTQSFAAEIGALPRPRALCSSTGTVADRVFDFESRQKSEVDIAGWRVIFKWLDGEPHEVRIVDYH